MLPLPLMYYLGLASMSALFADPLRFHLQRSIDSVAVHFMGGQGVVSTWSATTSSHRTRLLISRTALRVLLAHSDNTIHITTKN